MVDLQVSHMLGKVERTNDDGSITYFDLLPKEPGGIPCEMVLSEVQEQIEFPSGCVVLRA